jgi:hypothetical protein
VALASVGRATVAWVGCLVAALGACTKPHDQAIATATGDASPPDVTPSSSAGSGGSPALDAGGGVTAAPDSGGSGTGGATVPDAKLADAGTTAAQVLTIVVVGGGTASASVDGSDCTGTCTSRAPRGTTVAITATPGASAEFAGWSGACSGLGACTVVLDADRSVTATFRPLVSWTLPGGRVDAFAVSGDTVFVGGRFDGSVDFGITTVQSRGSSDNFLVGLDAAAKLKWVKSWGVTVNENVIGLAARPQGAVALSGTFYGTEPLDLDSAVLAPASGGWTSFVSTVSASGDVLSLREGGCQNSPMDVQGNGYDCEQTDPVPVTKRSAAGQTLWTGRDRYAFFVSRATVDRAGNLFLCSYTSSPIVATIGGAQKTFTPSAVDLAVVKVGSDGQTAWVTVLPSGIKGQSDSEPDCFDMAADAQGDLFVVGSFVNVLGGGALAHQSKGSRDLFLLKLGAAQGQPVFLRSYGGSAFDLATSVAVEDSGTILVGSGVEKGIDIGGAPSPGSALVRYAGTTGDFVSTVLPDVTVSQIARHQSGDYFIFADVYPGGVVRRISVK